MNRSDFLKTTLLGIGAMLCGGAKEERPVRRESGRGLTTFRPEELQQCDTFAASGWVVSGPLIPAEMKGIERRVI